MHANDRFGLSPGTTIRDSLYDLVPVSREAAYLLGTPEFIRLEGIQQLGFVSRVWPGARHTRFEHSLGVMFLMHEALARLVDRGASVDRESARTAIAAALLHDIGHYPFSHAIEELGPPVLSHEQVGRRLIEDSDITQILGDVWQVDPVRVARLIQPGSERLPPVDRLVRGLLSGALDVDKLDYLPRDAHACHVPYGGVDTSRLLDALRVLEIDDVARIGIDEKGVSPMHSLINARQEMFDNVYWHHANRACMVMLLRAVQEAVIAGMPPEELTHHDDASLLARLAGDDTPVITRRLVAGLRTRRLHKRGIEISARTGDLFEWLSSLFHRPDQRRVVEQEMTATLARLAGRPVADGDVLIDIPKPERWRTDVWVSFERPPVGFSSLMSWQDVVGIGDDGLKRYEEHRRLVRVVVIDELRDDVRRNWDRLLFPLLTGT